MTKYGAAGPAGRFFPALVWLSSVQVKHRVKLLNSTLKGTLAVQQVLTTVRAAFRCEALHFH